VKLNQLHTTKLPAATATTSILVIFNQAVFAVLKEKSLGTAPVQQQQFFVYMSFLSPN